ncbi:MAG: hypothetical protein HYX34_14110 [Actinobacteria bacterium]|nr:hypothetical protein [Actinomycetota bacterium]
MSDGDGTDGEVLPKPDALLALHGVTEALFETLRAWFDVPVSVALDLSDIDAAVAELADPTMIAALAMRKLQALRLLATPGVRTATDVVVAIIGDLERALVQAPGMRLRVQAETTDWDLALAELDSGGGPPDTPAAVDDEDVEVTRFRDLHARLHEAVYAVVEASDGEIRVFE